MRCREAVEGVHEDCCLHDLPRSDPQAPASVCCWCGDIYLSRYETHAAHGEYEPGIGPREKRRRAKAAETGGGS